MPANIKDEISIDANGLILSSSPFNNIPRNKVSSAIGAKIQIASTTLIEPKFLISICNAKASSLPFSRKKNCCNQKSATQTKIAIANAIK